MSAVYRSVRGAIRAAYESEVAVVHGRVPTVPHTVDYKTDGPDGPQIGCPLMGWAMQERGHVQNASVYQARYFRIAEAHWCLTLIRDSLDDDLMSVLDAKYTVLGEPLLEIRKYAAIMCTTGMVMKLGTYGPPDWDFTLASVAEWAGFGRYNRTQWADHLSVTRRTLRNWRHGRGWYGCGIDDRLRVMLAEAEYALVDPLHERGLVFRPDEPFCYANSMEIKKPSARWQGVLRLRTRETSDERTDIQAAA